MPLFGPKERKDKRKATEEPSDARGNPGKKQEVSNGSTQTPVAIRDEWIPLFSDIRILGYLGY